MRRELVSFASSVCLVACGGPGAPAGGAVPPAPSNAPDVPASAAQPPVVAPVSATAAAVVPPAESAEPAVPRGVKVGGDRDAHGCIGSAGYTWSELRKTCVRLFEVGMRLSPITPPSGSEATLSAFLVFATDDRAATKNDAVELFVPGSPGGTVLLREKKGGSYAKEGSGFKAIAAKRWTVEKDGKAAFTSE